MKKQIIFLVLVVFSISLVLGVPVCIDKDEPTWKEDYSLNLSIVNENDVEISWETPDDKPECSNISYYTISRNDIELNATNGTFYIDKGLDDGTYEYFIYPVDLGENEGNGISDSITLGEEEDDEDNGVSGSSGGGSSLNPLWECGDWSECEKGNQTRECEDLKDYRDNRTETRECSPDYIPSSDDEEDKKDGNIDDSGTYTSPDTETTATTSFITGMATTLLGEENQGKTLGYYLIAIIALALGVIFVKRQKKKKS